MLNNNEVRATVLANSNLVTILQQHGIALKRHGANWLGLCPYHNERTPSFVVNPRTQHFKCFGCGATGNVFTILQHLRPQQCPNYLATLTYLQGYLGLSMGLQTRLNMGTGGMVGQARQTAQNHNTVKPHTVKPTILAVELNTLATYLTQYIHPQRVMQHFINMYVGTAKTTGACIYWQVNQFRQVLTGNVVVYGTNGKRNKAIQPTRSYHVVCSWQVLSVNTVVCNTMESVGGKKCGGVGGGHDPVAKFPKNQIPPLTMRKHYHTAANGYTSCLFGLHQLPLLPTKTPIVLVESEKTALIAGLLLPEINGMPVCYMATSGLNGLTTIKMEPLRGRHVVLCPDFSYLARATWGIVPMRKKPNESGVMQPAPDGVLQDDYVSYAHKLRKLGCRVEYMDPAPHLDDNSDLGDLLLAITPLRTTLDAAPQLHAKNDENMRQKAKTTPTTDLFTAAAAKRLEELEAYPQTYEHKLEEVIVYSAPDWDSLKLHQSSGCSSKNRPFLDFRVIPSEKIGGFKTSVNASGGVEIVCSAPAVVNKLQDVFAQYPNLPLLCNALGGQGEIINTQP